MGKINTTKNEIIEITAIPVKKVRGKPFRVGKDERRNLDGKPKGLKNFDTIFEAAIRKIVAEKKIDIKDPEQELVVKAVVEGLKGNYPYFRDLMDRRYGKAPETITHNINPIPILGGQSNKQNVIPSSSGNKENSEPNQED